MSDIPQLVNLLEAVRQELWRGVGRLEAAVEAERVRDEALALNVETVARSAHDLSTAVAVEAALGRERVMVEGQLRWEGQVWEVAELVLMYFGTARAMGAFGLAQVAMGGEGTVVRRFVALLLALLLDVGVVVLVAASRLGMGGGSLIGRLAGCWQRYRRPAAAVAEVVAEPAEGAGGWWGALSSLWRGSPAAPAPNPDASPV